MTKKPTPLQVAIHECGHAVAHLVLDELLPYPGPFIRSVTIVPGDGFLGRVEADARVRTYAPRAQTEHDLTEAMRHSQRLHALYDIVEGFAGPIAELYYEHPIAPLMGKQETIPKILAGYADTDGDCASIRKTVEWLGEDGPLALLGRLWDIAYAIVASEWIGLSKAARVLRDRKTMAGDEFQEEWLYVRQSARARSQREIRLGRPHAGWRDALVATS